MSSNVVRIRLLILLGPIGVLVVVLSVMDALRPPQDGVLKASSISRLAISVGQSFTLQGAKQIREIVLRDARVTLHAQTIKIGTEVIELPAVSLQLTGDATLSLDRPVGSIFTPTLKVREGDTTAVLFSAEEAVDSKGFYVDISSNDSTGFVGDIILPPMSDIIFHASSATVIDDPSGRVVELLQAKPNAELSVSTGATVGIVKFSQFAESEGVLSVLYTGSDGFPLVSGRNSKSIGLADISVLHVAEEASFYVQGVKAQELYGVPISIRGSGFRFQRGLQASQSGFATSIVGRFDDIRVGTDNSSRSILPSRLSEISGLALIIFGAIAYLIDKLVTIFKFVAPSASD